MGIDIREYTAFRQEEISRLYEGVGWTNYTAQSEKLEQMYRNSLLVLGAWDGDALVGVLRTVGDGCSVVFIQDILVLPEYQRRGIGTGLMRALLERYGDVYQINLMTDDTEKTTAFYRSMGFSALSDIGCAAFTKMALPE